MKKNLMIALLALAGAGVAHASMQWDVPLADFDQLECWNAANCAPTTATVHMYNAANPTEEYLVDCNIFGPQGQPLVYSFQADVDEDVNCDVTYIVDECAFHAEGPGFRYDFVHVPTPFTMFYTCQPAFPYDIPIPGVDDGCWVQPIPHHMTLADSDNGVYNFSSSWAQNPDSMIVIDPGVEIFITEGVDITFTGEVQVNGTSDMPVVINGNDWGSLVFGEGADAMFHYTMVTGSMSEDDGGAFDVEAGAVVRLFDCLVAGNETAGNGGAAYIADGGILYTYGSTISHNTAVDGGNFYLGGGFALLEGELNLVTFATPANTEIVGAGIVTMNFSDIYPQADNFPGGWPGLDWYCDPGYVDPMGHDFHIAYWSLEDPEMINCTIDAAINEEVDADGTPRDMGAFAFDQHDVLHGATNLMVEDRPDDQGGYVLLSFDGSWNDGNDINPITMYSIWMQYPGMGDDEWVSAGTVAAINEPGTTYAVQVATLDDQYEGMENIHNFMVGTHSVWFPQAIPSETVSGFSVDNIAPMPVTASTTEEWAGDWSDPNNLPAEVTLDLTWTTSNANDFDHYEVFATLNGDAGTRERVYLGQQTAWTHVITVADHVDGDMYTYEFFAIDEHHNVSDVEEQDSPVFVGVDEIVPVTYALAQNFPNPFNPTTTIAFDLPQGGPVELTVYNLVGELVATLVDGPVAAGRHEVQFDASRLASGVYVYRMEAGQFSDLRKMILVK